MIDNVLADIGSFFGADRSYLFQVRDAVLLDNTHEWCATGIPPMIKELQGVPIEIAAHWFERFERSEAVHISDVLAMPDEAPEKETLLMQGIKSLVALPTVVDGSIVGFVGLDAVREYRDFLPGEIRLLQSTALAMQALLHRRASEQQIEAAHHAVEAERNRFRAILDAIPDLVLELDADGRFLSYKTQDHDMLVLPPDKVIGYTLQEALPPETAEIAQKILEQTLKTGSARREDVPLDTPDGRRFYSIAAARQGGADLGQRPNVVAVVRNITQDWHRRQHVQRLGRIVEEMSDQVILADAEGRIDYVNPAFERQTGYRHAEVQGRRPGDFLRGPSTDPISAARIDAAITAREVATIEIQNYRKDGAPFWTEMRIQPMHDGHGRLEGFMSVQTDVTERKVYQAALDKRTCELIAAEERLKGAVAALPHGFAYYDAEDRLVLCNHRYKDYYPLTAPVLEPGRTFTEILRFGLARGEYAEAVGREEEWLAERLAKHRKAEHQSEQLLSSGRWLQIIERRTPDGGQVGLRIDITDYKQSVRRAEKERLAAMDASRDGIGIANKHGEVIYMNRAMLQLFSLSDRASIPGHHWRALHPPDSREYLERHVIPELERVGSWQGEVLGRRENGDTFPLEISLTMREDHGILCVARDVTQRKKDLQVQAQLRERLQVAQRREILSQFSRGIAHDFNNLLAAISGVAGLVKDGIDVEENADRILAASQSGADLVAQLFELGRKPSPRGDIDLRRPLEEACDLLRVSLADDTALKVALPANPVVAHANATDIVQMTLNLGLNARDAIREIPTEQPHEINICLCSATAADHDGSAVQIGRIMPGRDYCVIQVSDTGVGIDPQLHKRVFEPSFTTKQDDGTGLGLSVVASLVSDYGGAVTLSSERGKGSTFKVYIPVKAVCRVSSLAPSNPTEGEIGRLDGLRILVVDDNRDVLHVISEYLERAGAEVVACSDPRDVAEAVRDEPTAWSLIVTDYDMPELNGAELASIAKSHVPDLPVILVSALPDWRSRCGDLGQEVFDAALGKPISAVELVTAARHVTNISGDKT
ncbi:PAS domain S-box protein [Rhodovulum adriaticum]|uniref:PAS domain S-box protein n=1 Tax=Rhodovulum adriaticum TaxID=35804 RepID=UPI0019042BB6|nr:PAS domain S-box protein [Rhodovulum adriaticum]MBK1637296.1 hypothetical protein [Rhodovulum adriaticum]